MQEAEKLCKFEDRDIGRKRRGFVQRGGFGQAAGEERRGPAPVGFQPNAQPFPRGPVLGDDGETLLLLRL